jgi:hypothetical protein
MLQMLLAAISPNALTMFDNLYRVCPDFYLLYSFFDPPAAFGRQLRVYPVGARIINWTGSALLGILSVSLVATPAPRQLGTRRVGIK